MLELNDIKFDFTILIQVTIFALLVYKFDGADYVA
jgi:hypothetical protein